MKYAEIKKHNSANEWWMVWFDKANKKDGHGFGFPTKEAAENALAMARWARKYKVKLV